ncbi:hypothetical protein H0H93_006195 [Arthromyces matolae]|nr:hypothetical protein H0H93_006195 [Arthromyces matolae]
MPKIDILCQLIDSERRLVDIRLIISIDNTASVSEVSAKLESLSNSPTAMQLWKLCVPRSEVSSEFLSALKFEDDIADKYDPNVAFLLNPMKMIEEVGPWPSDKVHVLVQMAPKDRLGKRKREENEFCHLKKELGLGSPSGIADPKLFSRIVGPGRHIKCNRPYTYETIPIELLDEAFCVFKARLCKSPSRAGILFLSQLALVGCEWYGTELDRKTNLQSVYERHTGLQLLGQQVPGTNFVTDGNLAPLVMPGAIEECKNVTGHALNQAIVYYAQYLCAMDHELSSRILTRFPSILIIDAGSTFAFYGAVWNGTYVQVEPLTPTFDLSTHYMDLKGRHAIASSLDAFKEGVKRIEAHYRELVETKGTDKIDPAMREFPYLRSFEINGKNVTLEYLSRVADTKLVYQAQDCHGNLYAVKFTRSYSTEAHRFLAEHDLAPKLRFSREIVEGSGWIVVVTDWSAGSLFEENVSREEKQTAWLKVKVAVQLLHDGGFVHGDIRGPNIVIIEKGSEVSIHIIDFDWAGKDGDATYPLDINLDVQRPKEVAAGGLITMDDDDVMVSFLDPT